MSNIEPNMRLELGDGFARATMEYGPDALDEMARRYAQKVDDEVTQQILARLGYVKPVRCRDCEHFTVDNSDHDCRSGWWCKRWNTDMVKPDGFCAWGVRRGGRMSCTYEPPKQETMEIGEHIDGIGTVLDPDDEEMIGFLELASKRREATK